MSVRDGMVLMESRPASASKGLSQFRRYLSVSYPSIPNAAAILAGGVVLIKVGAATEVEMKEKKARVEDALHATRAAVVSGDRKAGFGQDPWHHRVVVLW